MATIEPDGRVIYTATISCSNSAAQAQITNLLADSGSHWTIIPDTLLTSPGFAGYYTVVAQHQTNVAGAVLEVSGLTIEVQVEQHGGGSHQTKQISRTLYVHSLPLTGPHPFLSGDGLLGMDVFDDARADPVKDQSGGTAYLAQRV